MQFAQHPESQVYIAFELDDDTMKKSSQDIYDEYIWPASRAFGRALAAVGVNIKTKAPAKGPAGYQHHSYLSGLSIRGQMVFDGIRQKHLLTFDTFARKA